MSCGTLAVTFVGKMLVGKAKISLRGVIGADEEKITAVHDF